LHLARAAREARAQGLPDFLRYFAGVVHFCGIARGRFDKASSTDPASDPYAGDESTDRELDGIPYAAGVGLRENGKL
jgi:hypothetical protein